MVNWQVQKGPDMGEESMNMLRGIGKDFFLTQQLWVLGEHKRWTAKCTGLCHILLLLSEAAQGSMNHWSDPIGHTLCPWTHY